MQARADAVGRSLPLVVRLVVAGKVRLPERDVAHTADAVHQHLLRALRLERLDLFGIGGQVFSGCKVALLGRNGQLAQGVIERAEHGVLERGGVARGQGVALGVGPLVHVEAVDVLAVHVPSLQEIDRPLVHTHRADRQDEDELAPFFLGELDLHGDLMTHVDAELFEIRAFDGRKVLVPEALALLHGRGIVRDALVDLFNVPAFRQDLAEIGALQGVEHIHSSSSFCPAGAGDFFPCASIIAPARGRCQ